MGSNYKGSALENQKVEAKRLSSADLLVGVGRLPVRILETEWQEEVGAPDALWLGLSSGRYLVARYDAAFGFTRFCERCGDREPEIAWDATGMDRFTIHSINRAVWARFAEHQQEVAS